MWLLFVFFGLVANMISSIFQQCAARWDVCCLCWWGWNDDCDADDENLLKLIHSWRETDVLHENCCALHVCGLKCCVSLIGFAFIQHQSGVADESLQSVSQKARLSAKSLTFHPLFLLCSDLRGKSITIPAVLLHQSRLSNGRDSCPDGRYEIFLKMVTTPRLRMGKCSRTGRRRVF